MLNSSEAEELLVSGEDGVAEWNRLRASGQQVPLTLVLSANTADQDLDLRGVDLGGCRLAGSVLEHANLSGAYLFRADLSHVSLCGARLSGAKLAEADLRDG